MMVASDEDRLQPYCFAVVMPCADQNLDGVIKCGYLTMQQVRVYAEDIAMTIKHLHDQNIIHGDISLSNFVRSKWRLQAIDLGASARWCRTNDVNDKVDNEASLSYLGRKFSSGSLPPEMIYLCNGHTDVNKFEAYFRQQKQIGSTWNKIKPKVCSNGDIYLVKTFLTSYVSKTDPDKLSNVTRSEIMKKGFLPYDPILATPAADMWSFGTVLYSMCTGHTLFHTDANGDLADVNAFAELYHWNDETKEAKLSKVTCPLARELLRTLLSRDPKQRQDIDSALESKFFQCLNFESEDYRGKAEELKKEKSQLFDMITEFDRTVDRSTSAMCKTVFNVEEVNVPTCFILLPFSGLSDEENPSTIINDYKYAVIDTLLNSTSHLEFAQKLSFFAVQQEPSNLYLYLVDEYSGERVIPSDPYPIEIEANDLYALEAIFQIMSVALVSLKTVLNSSTLAKLFLREREVMEDDTILGLFEQFLRAGDYPPKTERLKVDNHLDLLMNQWPPLNIVANVERGWIVVIFVWSWSINSIRFGY